MDITSLLMEVPRRFSRSYSLQPRIVDVQRQGFCLVGQTLNGLQTSELRQKSLFPQVLPGGL